MNKKPSRNLLIWFFLFSLALTGWTIAQSLPVPKRSFNPLPFLAAKSPYPDIKESKPLGFEHCEPIHINHVGRHGSRHLSKGVKEELIAIITKAHQQNQLKPLAYKLLTMLHAVQDSERPPLIGQLTDQGREELRTIAQRVLTTFPEPFANDKAILLQSTRVQRAKDSMQAFLSGLIGINPTIEGRAHIKSGESEHCDPTLRFFEGCSAYSEYLTEQTSKEEFEALWLQHAYPTVSMMMKRVFAQDFLKSLEPKLQVLIAQNFYNLCQLQVDVDRSATQSGFCSFFALQKELELFNWREDAGHYFSKADKSTNNITHKLACPLLSEFLNTTKQAMSDKNAPAAHFRFAHAETIIPFYVLLGLYEDDGAEIILNNPDKRRFKTSAISPMAANLQWILYRCPNEQYVVRMRHNEKDRAFPIEGCTENGCPLEAVQRFYQTSGRTCDQKEWAHELCKKLNGCTLE